MRLSRLFNRQSLFMLFKYSIYLLLGWNAYLFFQEDWAASSHTFSGGVAPAEIFEAFTASIDTISWVFLLLLFELETWVISDDVLNSRGVKWGLVALRTVCYGFISISFFGYIAKFGLFMGASPYVVADVCAVIDGSLAQIITMDEYVVLTLENCAALNGPDLVKLENQALIAGKEVFEATRRLAMVDVINSAVWLMIVIILEIDVWLQLKGHYRGRVLRLSKIVKVLFYSILFICAAYWGILGGFLEFWDAFLWLVSFFFIEMNLFQWQQETEAA